MIVEVTILTFKSCLSVQSFRFNYQVVSSSSLSSPAAISFDTIILQGNFRGPSQRTIYRTTGIFKTYLTMTTQTRIQLRLQRDTGSIFYEDKDDKLAFHIEALRTTNPSPSTANMKSSSHSSQASTTVNSDSENEVETTASSTHGKESEATTDLVKSFLRQHLLKNGERSRCLIPLMKRDDIEALLIATVVLHLRKDGQRESEEGSVRDDGAAIRSLHKTLGSLVSVLQQREKVLSYLEENPHVAPRAEAEAETEED